MKLEKIDESKCTPDKSILEYIKREENKLGEKQKQKFNLGGGFKTNEPIKAAETLLKREYGDTFLFPDNDQANHDPIFIPPVFTSNQYKKKKSSTILDYDFQNEIIKTLKNQAKKEDNFGAECEKFLKTVKENEIDKITFEDWVKKTKEEYPDNFKSDPSIKWLGNLSWTEGSEKFEYWFYEELKKNRNVLKDFVILHSSDIKFKTEGEDKKIYKQQEFDLILISHQKKLIIGIEIKRTLNEQATDKALKQLETYKNIFEEKFGGILEEGWTFFPVIAAGYDDFESGEISTLHYINGETDMESWLTDVLDEFPSNSDTDSDNSDTNSDNSDKSLSQMKKLLQIFVFTVHSPNKRPVTATNWVEYITDAIKTVSTVDNIIFYSKDQLNILNSDDYNKLIIKGAYGTGKSLLLQEKAKMMVKTEEYKVIFAISCPEIPQRTLYYHSMEEKFGEDFEGIHLHPEPSTEWVSKSIKWSIYFLVFIPT